MHRYGRVSAASSKKTALVFLTPLLTHAVNRCTLRINWILDVISQHQHHVPSEIVGRKLRSVKGIPLIAVVLSACDFSPAAESAQRPSHREATLLDRRISSEHHTFACTSQKRNQKEDTDICGYFDALNTISRMSYGMLTIEAWPRCRFKIFWLCVSQCARETGPLLAYLPKATLTAILLISPSYVRQSSPV